MAAGWSERDVPARPPIRIVVADEHPVVREGFRHLIERAAGMELVGECDGASELPALCLEGGADVLLLGISVAGPGFLETLRRLRAELPELRVLVVSIHPEESFGLRALEAGAAGYLSKKSSPQILLNAIRRVRNGQLYVSEDIASRLAGRLYGREPPCVTDSLSPREYQIFLMLGQGASVTAIANTLGLSPKTVSTHRARILEKTKLQNNAAIIRFVVEHGLTE